MVSICPQISSPYVFVIYIFRFGYHLQIYFFLSGMLWPYFCLLSDENFVRTGFLDVFLHVSIETSQGLELHFIFYDVVVNAQRLSLRRCAVYL